MDTMSRLGLLCKLWVAGCAALPVHDPSELHNLIFAYPDLVRQFQGYVKKDYIEKKGL